MRINDDLTLPVTVHAARMDWIASPSPGVDRRMLFWVGDEVARATSIVRYAPGSAFPRHIHDGGEEILVLEGTFQDEYGDYPAGSYFRNPPGTSHAPASQDGCTIFVRLWQFREGDSQHVVRRPESTPAGGVTLFDDDHEQVCLMTYAGNAAIHIANTRGQEVLVVAGSMKFDSDQLEHQTWLRLPTGTAFEGVAGPDGVHLWLRDGPLLHTNALRLPQTRIAQ